MDRKGRGSRTELCARNSLSSINWPWSAQENPGFDSVSLATNYSSACDNFSRQLSLASSTNDADGFTLVHVGRKHFIRLEIPSEQTTIISEDLVFLATKQLGIEPLAAHLFALFNPQTRTFLHSGRKVHCAVNEARDRGLVLRLRVLCQIDILAETDKKALEYLFAQCRQDFLDGQIEEFASGKESMIASAKGLAALDMLRAMEEDNLTADQVMEGWQKRFVPPHLLKSVNTSVTQRLKTSLVTKLSTKHLREILEDRASKQKSLSSLKKQYVEFLLSCAPYYMCEQFFCRLGMHSFLPTETIRINLVETDMTIQHRVDHRWRTLCLLTDICDVSLNPEKHACQVNRLTGPPFVFAFSNADQLESFVGLVDMVYRYTHKFYYNVCQALPTPSLQTLRTNKCHGPMDKDVMYAKLHDKSVGTFTVCQSTDLYDTFRIDLVTSSNDIKSYVIDSEPGSGSRPARLHLRQSDHCFGSLQSLLHHYAVMPRDGLVLKECIRPNENDVVGLKLFPKLLEYSVGEELVGIGEASSLAVCIPPKCLVFHQSYPPIDGGHCRILRAALKQSNRRQMEVVVKEVSADLPMESTQKLLTNAQSLLQLSNPSMLVRLLGIQLSPLALVSEYYPLGNLLDLIRAKRRELSLRHLLEAAAQVAITLYCLNAQKVTYDPIRAKYVYVAEYCESGMKVKLGPVGLEDKVHWRGPDIEIDHARSGVWAFGTFLWELFSFAGEPLPEVSQDEALTLYRNGYRLEKPAHCPVEVYSIMEKCWNATPSLRPELGQLQRDMNQIMAMNYNETRALCPADGLDEPWKRESKCEFLLRVTGNCLMHNLNANAVNEDKDGGQASYDPWLIDESQLKIIDQLGEGRYGQVSKALYTDPLSESEPRVVAVKQLKQLKADRLTGRDFDEMRAEMNIMKALSHDNVVETVGVVLDPTPLLVMEFVANGALNVYLRAHVNSLPQHLLLQMATDVACGMAYLQGQDIVHRDLAARNILVTAELHAKIGDFGLARFLDTGGYYLTQDYQRSIPLAWYAPEVIEQHKYSSKSDCWSFGVLLWEMFSYAAAPYFCELSVLSDRLRQGQRLPKPAACPQAVYVLMQQCWQYETVNRPDFRALHLACNDLLQHSDLLYDNPMLL